MVAVSLPVCVAAIAAAYGVGYITPRRGRVEAIDEPTTEEVGSRFTDPVAGGNAVDAFHIVSDAGVVAFPLEGQDATDAHLASQAWDTCCAAPAGQSWTLSHGHRVRGRVG